MDELMKKYEESQTKMSAPIELSQMTRTMNLRDLMKYAREKGVRVEELTEAERMAFLR
jgi:hypothetical protein